MLEMKQHGAMVLAGRDANTVGVLAGSRKCVLIDMQKVSFLGSMGRSNHRERCPSRTLKNRGGKVAMFGPDEEVDKVLIMSGVSSIVPIHRDLQTALAA